MERDTLTKDLSMINKYISLIIDNTRRVVTSRSEDLMGQFVKTEIRTKGPLTLKEKVPLTKLQLATLSIPFGQKSKEKKLKEISNAVEGYLQEKMQELSDEIAKSCEGDIEKMWTSLEKCGENFDSLLKRHTDESPLSNTQSGSLWEIIKEEETKIPDIVIYDRIFDTHSFMMWHLTKVMLRPMFWAPPNPIDQMRNNLTHFYENIFNPIAEYLEQQTSKLIGMIGEPFERLKSYLNEYGNQMIDNCRNVDGMS